MKTAASKVLYPVRGQELILYPLEAVSALPGLTQIVVVVGYKKDEVIAVIKKKLNLPGRIRLDFVEQAEQKGTADAVKTALPGAREDTVVIICGDSPLITAQTLQKAADTFFSNRCKGVVLTAVIGNPASYGRVIRSRTGKLLKIKELKDLTVCETKIREVNSGMYFLSKSALAEALRQIKQNRRKKEFFLTDLVEIFNKKRYNINSFALEDEQEMFSVNTMEELAEADRVMNDRLIQGWMRRGVRFIDPKSAFLGKEVRFGSDAVIYPFVSIENKVAVGNGCTVGPFVHITEGVTVKDRMATGSFRTITKNP